MFPNGQITRIVVDNIANVTTPDLDGATFDMTVFIADSTQPIWPGNPLPVMTDFAEAEEVLTDDNAGRYAILHP